VSISPANPYDPLLMTPTKTKTPVSDKATPTSLVRNLFSRSRPGTTPTSASRGVDVPANTVVLPPTKRSLGDFSPSPPDDDEREVTPTPTRPKRPRKASDAVDVKPKLEVAMPKAELGHIEMPPAHQSTIATRSTGSNGSAPRTGASKRHMPSPTLRNELPTPGEQSTSQQLISQEGQPRPARAKKRVRLASPESGLAPRPPSHPSQTLGSSAETLTSAHTVTSAKSEGSGSTLPPNFSHTSWQFHFAPPLLRDVMQTIDPEVVYTEPHYSNAVDVPPRAKMFAGRMFTLKGNGVPDLPEFLGTGATDKSWLKTRKTTREKARFGWEWAFTPPRPGEVVEYCQKEDDARMTERECALSTSTDRSPAQIAPHEPARWPDTEESIRLQVLAEEEDQGRRAGASEHVGAGYRSLWCVGMCSSAS